MKNNYSLLTITVIFYFILIITSSCGTGSQEPKSSGEAAKPASETASPKGIGEIKTVELTSPLNDDMIKRGKGIFDMKCSACHKLTAEKLEGPGWSDVTSRRTPEWIMNMITNTDVMLDKDPEAQKLLETCLVRMPNQGLSVGDCRDILEFMRKNDNQK